MRGDLALVRTLSEMTDLIMRIGADQEHQIASALLLALQVPTKPGGFDYLQYAVQLYREDPTQRITKELYPAVAARYGRRVTAYQVERGIRIAIDQAWRTCDPETWKLFFPAPGGLWARPSNTEVISRLAKLIDLWLAVRQRSVG